MKNLSFRPALFVGLFLLTAPMLKAQQSVARNNGAPFSAAAALTEMPAAAAEGNYSGFSTISASHFAAAFPKAAKHFSR